jgi:chemotaxis methyl-accepting protein methylase
MQENQQAQECLEQLQQALAAHGELPIQAYKPSMVLRRVHQRMRKTGAGSWSAYVERLHGNPAERMALQRAMMVGVTTFFRDEPVWEAIREQMEALLRSRCQGADRQALRVWVCGCSTGEEAYTWLMVLHEVAEAQGFEWEDPLAEPSDGMPLRLLATDANPAAISHARQALYGAGVEQDLSPQRLERFFRQESGGWRIRPEFRRLVTFARHDVLRDPPLGQLDWLSCRNLLLYLETPVQQGLLQRFHRCLKPEGGLLLGQAESPWDLSHLFARIGCDRWPSVPLYKGLNGHDEACGSASNLHSYWKFSMNPSVPSLGPAGPEQPLPQTLSMAPQSTDHDMRTPDGPVPDQGGQESLEVALKRKDEELAALRLALAQAQQALQDTRLQAQQSREELLSNIEELQATQEELTTSLEEVRTLSDALTQARAEAEVGLAHYIGLFDKAPVAYVALDEQARMLQVNQKGAHWLNGPQNQLAGHTLLQFVAEPDRIRLAYFVTRQCRMPLPEEPREDGFEAAPDARPDRAMHKEGADSSAQPAGEALLFHLNTELQGYRAVQAYAMPFSQGRCLMAFWDASPRQAWPEGQERIRQQAEVLQLFDDCQRMNEFGIWELDALHRRVYWSLGMYRLHDVSPQDFCPTNDEVFCYVVPEHRTAARRAIQMALERGQPFDFILALQTARGRKLKVRTTAAVRVEHGRVLKVYGVMQRLDDVKTLETLTSTDWPDLAPGQSLFGLLDEESHPSRQTPR